MNDFEGKTPWMYKPTQTTHEAFNLLSNHMKNIHGQLKLFILTFLIVAAGLFLVLAYITYRLIH